MAKSQQTYNKKEKEQKRLKKKKEKLEKKEQRKVEKEENGPKSFEDMLAYVDENGNLTTEKPDPTKKKRVFKLEDIQLGVPTRETVAFDPIHEGKVKFFNHEKGYGFILDLETEESLFVHINNVQQEIKEGDRVLFEMEKSPKGMTAVNVKLGKKEPKPVVKETPEEEEDSNDPSASSPSEASTSDSENNPEA